VLIDTLRLGSLADWPDQEVPKARVVSAFGTRGLALKGIGKL
jgi:hypothetical protein